MTSSNRENRLLAGIRRSPQQSDKQAKEDGLTVLMAEWLNKIVFVSLLALIVITIIPYGTVDAWWQAVFECIVFFLTGAWVIAALLRGSWQIKKAWILLPLILLAAYAFCQSIDWFGGWFSIPGSGNAQHLLSIDQYQTQLTARKLFALILFLGLLLIHVSTEKRFRWLVRVLVGVGLASALFGILRQLSQPQNSTVGFLLPFLYPGVGYGQFISANVFAYLMEMSFGLVAGLIVGRGLDRKWAPIYAAIAVLVWTALVLSSSRGGILGFACAAIFLIFVSLSWYAQHRSSRLDVDSSRLALITSSVGFRIFAIVLIVIVLAFGVIWMGGERLTVKMGGENTQDVLDGSSRREIWRASWALIKQHPVTGSGFGTFYLAIPEHQIGSGRIKLEQAHNDYLDLLANGGVIAVLFAAWFLVNLALRARGSFKSNDPYRRAAALGAVAGILAVAVHSLVDFGLQVTGIGVVFAALVVIAVAELPSKSTASKLV
jgi:O-antigen ligase